MLKILQELNNLNSTQLDNISKIISDFSNSISRLADDARRREFVQKEQEIIKLSEREKNRLEQLKLQRNIMIRYQKGQSFEQIGAATGYHPKTIYKKIKQYETDISMLKQMDNDLLKYKYNEAEKMVDHGFQKDQIVNKLHISAHCIESIIHTKSGQNGH
ncbi:hypothetical protein [Pseudemcibacter aquimaris]|uniref:hypothetical protein n=1 Tax=Pseudemcibacter aquimaris TaxID=2857064 RepID=UPI002011D901|nr:hypothetical protein [Pseudemcibacter aquimaris]MCC3859782.1 hypothetical protein [Pseudemcibacter aquimaris]WDU60176.1 hypothetical protein KW060_07885 [Pseudemcibacter aquimaris]